MDSKKLSYIAVFGALGFLAYAVHDVRTRSSDGGQSALVSYITQASKPAADWVPNETVTGNVLASNFAQSQRDWGLANMYLDKLSHVESDDPATTLRMMLLAVSAGQFDRAAEYAHRIKAAKTVPDDQSAETPSSGDGHDLASMVLMAQAVRAGDLAGAETQLMALKSTALTAFVRPVILNWIKAGQKKPIEGWTEGLSLLQALHRGLAAEWAGQKDVADHVFDSLSRTPLPPLGGMMVAAYDIRNNRAEQARVALAQILAQNPMNSEAKKMLDALGQGQSPVMRPEFAYHMQGVTAGVAMAFRDLAQMMLVDEAGDSALIFAQMGRLIRADVPALSILVGNIFYDQRRYDDAATAFMSVQPDDIDYVDAQIRLSELRGEQGQVKDAIAILESLMKSNPQPRVAYALGEIYRIDKDNKKAVSAFDQAIEMSGGKVEDDLWSIYYMRAMALDDMGEWDKAEADLKKALTYRPNDPHVLNYLGYSWADRNINLVEARNMLIQALTRAPTDPYITDSLGWVYFRQGDLAQASVLLERAVSLKPYDPVLNDHLGDVYEKVGRTLEARYQWRRALDYADAKKDEELITQIKAKLGGDTDQAK